MKKLLSDRNNGAFGGRFAAVCVALTVVATFMISCDDEDTYRSSNSANGHEWVDLGLSVRWATCNVGALSPSDYGDCFAWGEITPKAEYTSSNCLTWNKVVGDISGNPEYDAARANWGGSWRMPTKEELYELSDNCTWECTTVDGNRGMKVIGPNGNSIFLPAAGWRPGVPLGLANQRGFYWCSTPYEDDTQWNPYLGFDARNGFPCITTISRDRGLSIRPVLE